MQRLQWIGFSQTLKLDPTGPPHAGATDALALDRGAERTVLDRLTSREGLILCVCYGWRSSLRFGSISTPVSDSLPLTGEERRLPRHRAGRHRVVDRRVARSAALLV